MTFIYDETERALYYDIFVILTTYNAANDENVEMTTFSFQRTYGVMNGIDVNNQSWLDY